jgi:hypothetical protein
MTCLVQLPPETAQLLKREKETGFGYQVASVELSDGRHFDQVVISEGCVIAVRGFAEVPFALGDVVKVQVNHKRWNFRKLDEGRKPKSKVASA